jgi:hypothetical protein
MGAPYLARFSRDMGYRKPYRSLPLVGKNLPVERCSIPYLAKNERDMGHPSVILQVQALAATEPQLSL